MKRTVILAAVTALLLSGCGSSDSSLQIVRKIVMSANLQMTFLLRLPLMIVDRHQKIQTVLKMSQLLHQRQLQNRLRSQHRKRKQMKLLKSQRYTTFPQPILPCRLFLFISN